MTKTTAGWVKKAEGDFNTVLTLRRSRKRDRYDNLCFLCQQCAEKYLKARLCESKLAVPRIHDLEQLLNAAIVVQPLWAVLRRRLQRLSNFAVFTRYPGHWATPRDAAECFVTCKEVREFVRASLGLP